MIEIDSLKELKLEIKQTGKLWQVAIHSMDLRKVKEDLLDIEVEDCLFLGCDMDIDILRHLQAENYVFPELDVPYKVFFNDLYSKEVLYSGFDRDKPKTYYRTLDHVIYSHYLHTGKETALTIKESLARRLHDHSITDALTDFIDQFEEREVVAIMGGHSLPRTDKNFKKVVLLSKQLAEQGFLMISGGGPGAMEATHVGVWFAGRPIEDVEQALAILATAPDYQNKRWLRTAFEVIEKYPRDRSYESIGIPTWLYGHEPPTPFASKIAKYFANSVREEGLLALAKGGVIYAPGSAGTMQEVFQDAAQNHYKSFGIASPMIFLDKNYWTETMPVYPMLKTLAKKGRYANLLLSKTDSIKDVVKRLKAFRKGGKPTS